MIIIRTPFRISFFGGGTDYPAWYKEHGGSVISTTINKYSFLVLRKLPNIFDYNYRVRYYEKQEAQKVDEINIPVIREAIKYMNYQQGVDITHHGDLPNRTGKYRGLFQFDNRSWEWVGGSGDPARASVREQYKRAQMLVAKQGFDRAFPQCSKIMGVK